VVDIEAGTATWWLLVDMTEQEINGVSEQKKDQLKQSVNQERDRRWPGTVNCDLAGDGSLELFQRMPVTIPTFVISRR
jgi:hypothetical protein